MSAAHVIAPLYGVPPGSWEAEFGGWIMTGGLGAFSAPGPFRVKIEREGGTRKKEREFRAFVHMGGMDGNWHPLRSDMKGAEDPAFMKACVAREFEMQRTDWRRLGLISGGPA